MTNEQRTRSLNPGPDGRHHGGRFSRMDGRLAGSHRPYSRTQSWASSMGPQHQNPEGHGTREEIQGRAMNRRYTKLYSECNRQALSTRLKIVSIDLKKACQYRCQPGCHSGNHFLTARLQQMRGELPDIKCHRSAEMALGSRKKHSEEETSY